MRNTIKTVILFSFVMMQMNVLSQTILPLYNGSIPNSKPAPDEETSIVGDDKKLRIHKISRPTLTVFLPDEDKATGAAVIICPGGGYTIAAFSHEGTQVAERFNEMGVAAFVLKYRIPDDKTMHDKTIGPLQDAQRAIQLVREHANEWKIKPDKIAIMGFSAGGHLAATAATHFNKVVIDNPKKTSLRPDAAILVYPVISFSDSLSHGGSRNQLIGKDPSAALKRDYSNELQVTEKTPPAFLVHAKDDKAVKVENSLLYAEALKQAKVPVEVYLYENGGHGFGMVNNTSEVKWMDLVEPWLFKVLKLKGK